MNVLKIPTSVSVAFYLLDTLQRNLQFEYFRNAYSRMIRLYGGDILRNLSGSWLFAEVIGRGVVQTSADVAFLERERSVGYVHEAFLFAQVAKSENVQGKTTTIQSSIRE